MSDFRLAGEQRVLLTHMAFYGLAAILEGAGIEDLTVRWDGVTACLDAPTLDASVVDDVVRAHAAAHGQTQSWVMRDADIDGSRRGLMSPRLTVFKSAETWQEVQALRHEVLQHLTDDHAWLDLGLLGAVGEPCYWSRNAKGDVLQDDGASRFEMQPRNRGSEIVSNRLRPLARAVAERAPGRVAAGLEGTGTVDELGKGAADGVTATGFSVPGPVDNALAWCALWGISAFPLAPRVNATAITSGHLGRGRREWFFVPVWSTRWRPARLRTVLASAQLHTAAAAGLPQWSRSIPELRSAGVWLRARGVVGVVRFPIERFGSDNAPERRALYGDAVAVGGRR